LYSKTISYPPPRPPKKTISYPPSPFLSADPKALGAPTGHIVPVTDVRISAGAEFVVALTGDIMTMPGLPKIPASEKVGLNEDGHIYGLF
jgi:formate--tetrahydrofolate ligase